VWFADSVGCVTIRQEDPMGRFFVAGQPIETWSPFVDSRALPGPFTHLSWAILPEQSIVNIGVAGPLYGAFGGGFQAEYISGPPIQFSQLPGAYWHGKHGNA
jgi:hypothetical protein